MSYLDEAAQDMAESFKRIFITAFGHGYDFGCEKSEGELKHLKAENAELRSLCRDMHGELVACEENGYVCGGHKFDERAEKLGVKS